MKTPFLVDIAKTLKSDEKAGDKSFYGVVQDKLMDGNKVIGYKVSLGGKEDIVEARKLAGAEVGDTVMVMLMANGSMVVTGRKDGDGDAIEAKEKAEEAYSAAETASGQAAEAIKEVQDLTSHFWYDDQGAHVKGDQTGYQTDLTSNGMIINDGSGNKIASYQSQSVHLGIGKENASLYLCNDVYHIRGQVVNNEENATYENFLAISPSMSDLSVRRGVWIGSAPSTSVDSAVIGALYDTTKAYCQLQAKNGDVTTIVRTEKDAARMYYQDLSGHRTAVSCYSDRVEISGKLSTSSSIAASGTVTGSNIPSGTILTANNYQGYSTFNGEVSGTTIKATSTNPSTFSGRIDCTGLYAGGNVSAGDTLYGQYLRLTNQPNTGSTYDAWWQSTTDTGSTEYALRRGGSARRWKNSIEKVKDDYVNPEKLYDLKVRQFYWNDGMDMGNDLKIGLIADEVDDIFPAAACYDTDENGEVFACNWNVKVIVPAMLKLIQDQKKEIDDLTKRIEALEVK